MSNRIDNADCELIMPVAEKDLDLVMFNLSFIKKNIRPKKIIVITNILNNRKEINRLIEWGGVEVIHEDDLLPDNFLTFKEIFKILQNNGAEKRTGWYFQQFLKMAYAFRSSTEYYISWDADTIPISKISLFEENKPCFGLKDEYHKPYFDTMNRLFGIDKIIEKSFIVEHMIFKCEYMKEIINEINLLDVSKKWFENIIGSIEADDIPGSGFSEFETYGTYVLHKHSQSYNMRNISAQRLGGLVFNKELDPQEIEWISGSYSTVSFEKGHKKAMKCELYKNALLRKVISASLYCSIYFKVWHLKNYISKIRKSIRT